MKGTSNDKRMRSRLRRSNRAPDSRYFFYVYHSGIVAVVDMVGRVGRDRVMGHRVHVAPTRGNSPTSIPSRPLPSLLK